MSDQNEIALRSSALTVLEELAFMLPMPEMDDSKLRLPRQMSAAVDFHGLASGSLIVSLHGDLAATLAANMLGESAQPSEFQQKDALKEVVNVICGNFLPCLAGKDAVYRICAPRIIGPEEWSDVVKREPSAGVKFGVEEGCVDLRLFLETRPDLKEPTA